MVNPVEVRLYSIGGSYFLSWVFDNNPAWKCRQMNEALFMLSEWMDSVPSVPLGSHLLPSLTVLPILSTESARAKLHLGALQPLCLSGWFTLCWPGLGLPGPHYQLLATGTHCSWQTHGRGTLYRDSSSEKRGVCFFFFFYSCSHVFRCKDGKGICCYSRRLSCAF